MVRVTKEKEEIPTSSYLQALNYACKQQQEFNIDEEREFIESHSMVLGNNRRRSKESRATTQEKKFKRVGWPDSRLGQHFP